MRCAAAIEAPPILNEWVLMLVQSGNAACSIADSLLRVRNEPSWYWKNGPRCDGCARMKFCAAWTGQNGESILWSRIVTPLRNGSVFDACRRMNIIVVLGDATTCSNIKVVELWALIFGDVYSDERRRPKKAMVIALHNMMPMTLFTQRLMYVFNIERWSNLMGDRFGLVNEFPCVRRMPRNRWYNVCMSSMTNG